MIGTVIVLLFFVSTIYNFNKMSRLIELQVIYTVCNGFLIYNLGAPRLALYLCDWINMIFLLHMLVAALRRSGTQHRLARKSLKYSIISFLMFVIVGTISFILNFEDFRSFLLYSWGLRNYGRFAVFFLACVYYLKGDSVFRLFKKLEVLLYISVLLSFYEYYVLGLGFTGNSGDLIGGIFGISTSGNSALCMFCTGMCAYSINAMLKGECSTLETASVILSSLFSAALGEIKFFFILIIIVAAIIIVINRPSIKSCILVTGGAIILIYMIGYMDSVFNGSGMDFFTIDEIMKYATKTGYSYTTDSINRIGGISQINRLIFGNRNSMLGVGLGNADYSSFFSSEIHDRWGFTNYTWFIIPFLYLETGWIGLLSFFWIFVGLLIDVLRLREAHDISRKSVIALICASFCLMIYNSSLRVDAAYIYYLFLSIPFVINRDYSEAFCNQRQPG